MNNFSGKKLLRKNKNIKADTGYFNWISNLSYKIITFFKNLFLTI